MNVRKYEIFELTFTGPADGNPFEDQSISATFIGPEGTKTVNGFYDGDGIYKVRFMPAEEGTYTYEVTGNFEMTAVYAENSGCGKASAGPAGSFTGTFTVLPAAEGVHGPVRVSNKYHFAYADGTMYYPVGTTCYVWAFQNEALREQTLKTLSEGYFNKIRFCIFPKHYVYNLHEPVSYPYEGTPMDSSVLTPENFNNYNGSADGNSWNFRCFNPAHFRHLEDCITKLGELGIEADLILFHPYDRWGFSEMSREDDLFYLRYLTARLSAFRNVWWSFANEYDLMKAKSHEDWQAMGACVMENDPYDHLRSIHNCVDFYDHTEPWITHACIQRQDLYRTTEYTDEWRKQFGKPIIGDEISYEGDIQYAWGNIGGKELTRRFWEAAVRGGYAGHGETFLGHSQEIENSAVQAGSAEANVMPAGLQSENLLDFKPLEKVLWWSHGGKLYGEAPARLRFLQQILKETPGPGLKHLKREWDDSVAVPDIPGSADEGGDHDYYLFYFGFFRPTFREFNFTDGCEYEAEVIDTWEMTVTNIGRFKGRFNVPLPGKEYMALRLKKVQ